MIWILGILLIIISIQFVRYRRQIKDICRQMSFLEEEQSNKLVTIQYATKEFEDLAGHINVLNEKCRKQVWEYRQKDERLKEAITNLSHDIRTPLTSLGGYFDLLCDCEEEQDEERYQQIIRERIQTLETMLEELFTYTKLQNDAYVLELQKENITKIVCDNILSFYQEIKKRKIEPDIRVEEDNVWIWGNQTAAARIIQNIIRNALLHGSGGLEIRAGRENRIYSFECSNTVENPEEIDVEQVFTRFYKSDSARQAASTGLGLAITKELTERMGGTICARLEGNCFCIRVEFGIME